MSDVSMYGDWSKEELIAHIARLENRKQHGLVWEEDQAEGESDAGYHPQAVLILCVSILLFEHDMDG